MARTSTTIEILSNNLHRIAFILTIGAIFLFTRTKFTSLPDDTNTISRRHNDEAPNYFNSFLPTFFKRLKLSSSFQFTSQSFRAQQPTERALDMLFNKKQLKQEERKREMVIFVVS